MLTRNNEGSYGYKTIKEKIANKGEQVREESKEKFVESLKKKYGHYWWQKATGSERETLSEYDKG